MLLHTLVKAAIQGSWYAGSVPPACGSVISCSAALVITRTSLRTKEMCQNESLSFLRQNWTLVLSHCPQRLRGLYHNKTHCGGPGGERRSASDTGSAVRLSGMDARVNAFKRPHHSSSSSQWKYPPLASWTVPPCNVV